MNGFLKEETLWERMRDKIPYAYRMERFYDDTRYVIKGWWQRRIKGYADSECWNLDRSLSTWIVPRLKHLRNNAYSTPPNLEIKLASEKIEDKYTLTLEDWRVRLDKMIYAFEFVLNEDDHLEKCYPEDFDWGWNLAEAEQNGSRKVLFKDNRKPDYTYYNECEKKYNEGMDLFRLYFRHLWD